MSVRTLEVLVYRLQVPLVSAAEEKRSKGVLTVAKEVTMVNIVNESLKCCSVVLGLERVDETCGMGV